MGFKFNIKTNINMNIVCPYCKTKFPAGQAQSGEFMEGKCPNCGKDVRIPAGNIMQKISKRLAGIDIKEGSRTEAFTTHEVYQPGEDAARQANIPHESYRPPMPGEHGYTGLDRPISYEKAKRLAKYFNIAGIVITLWAAFFPFPYLAAVLAAFGCPLAALAAMRYAKGQIGVGASRKSEFPDITIALIGPGIALPLRALFDYHLVSAGPMWLPVGVFTVLTALLFYFYATVQGGPVKYLIMLPFLFAYSYGAVIEANCMLDTSKPAVYTVKVLEKRISHSSKGGNTYYIKVSPWGPKTEGNEIDVRRKLYDAVAVGGSATVNVKDGALEIPWYFVRI